MQNSRDTVTIRELLRRTKGNVDAGIVLINGASLKVREVVAMPGAPVHTVTLTPARPDVLGYDLEAIESALVDAEAAVADLKSALGR